MRIEAFVQARMGSTRLPGKVLKEVLGRPLLGYLIERLSQANEIDDIVILTTDNARDEPIVAFCENHGIAFYRGSEEDVLDRYLQAALERKPDAIVRITSDCPLIDPEVVDQVVKSYREGAANYDYVSNTLTATFPRGLDTEVFSYKALQKVDKEALTPEEREHATLYIYRHPEIFRLKNIEHKPDLSLNRWTVDTAEDFALVSLILEHLYPQKHDFRLKDVLLLLAQHPEWNKINSHIRQKELPSYND